MTQMQESKLMRALQLLRESGLTATAIHTPSNTFYKVLNRAETKKQHKPIFHYVYRSQKTHKFVCDGIHPYCQDEGKICVHKAAAFVAETGGDIDAACRIAAQPTPAAPVVAPTESIIIRATPTMSAVLQAMRPLTPVLQRRAQETW